MNDLDPSDLVEIEAGPSRLAFWIVTPLALILGLFIFVLATTDGDSGFGPSPLLQKPAPAITGVTLTGETFDLSEERGRFVVVNFFQSDCVPCIREHPELMNFDAAHRDLGDATLVSVVFSDSEAGARRFFEENGGGDWPVLATDTGTYAVQYGVVAAPETFIIDPNGIVIEKRLGAITADWLEAQISGRIGVGA